MHARSWTVVGIAAAALVIFGLLAATARGQYDNPYVPTNEYGTPDMSQIELTPAGHYEECIAFCVDTPLGDVGVEVGYDLYQDNYGNTWVVPSPLTIFITALWPEYIPEGLAGRSDGWAYGSLLVGMVQAMGGLEALGIEVEGVNINTEEGIVAAFQDYLRTLPDHWAFMGQLALALGEADPDNLELPFFGDLELWQLSWLYPDNPFDPSDDDPSDDGTPVGTPVGTPTPRITRTPTATPTRRPTPTPRPTATPLPTVECPPESISQQPPMAEVIELSPPNPVVQGQGGRGLDVKFLAVSFPVIHRWWTLEPEWVCTWWDVETYGVPAINNGKGCCPEDQQLPDGGCRMDTDDCWWVLGDLRCVEHVEAIPDLILPEYLGATADLRRGSIEWIETDLAQKYPGARVRAPHLHSGAWGDPLVAADGRCLVEATAHFDFLDPGYYDITVYGHTAGTQYTPPRSFSRVHPTPQPVYLIDTILLR